MTEEHIIQNQIRIALANSCVIFRTNAGDFWQGDIVYSKEFRQKVLINLRKVEGLPTGFSDLLGVRKSDGKAVFIEVKTPKGKPSKEQINFINQMKKHGAIAEICRSVEEAVYMIDVDYPY